MNEIKALEESFIKMKMTLPSHGKLMTRVDAKKAWGAVKTTASCCMVCGKASSGIGVYVSNEPGTMGASPKMIRMFYYGLCLNHENLSPDALEAIIKTKNVTLR